MRLVGVRVVGQRCDPVVASLSRLGHEVAPTTAVAGQVDQAALEQLLSLLPTKQRAAVVLRVIEGLSEAEAAAALRCAPGTVASNLSRGLARLRAHLPEGATHD